MSISNQINSIISKLTTINSKTDILVFNSEKALIKQLELKQRINKLYIDETNYVVLGTFLQNVNLSLFTEDELFTLISFDYASINAIKVLPNENVSAVDVPMYDLNKTIINLSFKELNSLNEDFKKLHSINKSLSLEYLISYIVSQV